MSGSLRWAELRPSGFVLLFLCHCYSADPGPTWFFQFSIVPQKKGVAARLRDKVPLCEDRGVFSFFLSFSFSTTPHTQTLSYRSYTPLPGQICPIKWGATTLIVLAGSCTVRNAVIAIWLWFQVCLSWIIIGSRCLLWCGGSGAFM